MPLPRAPLGDGHTSQVGTSVAYLQNIYQRRGLAALVGFSPRDVSCVRGVTRSSQVGGRDGVRAPLRCLQHGTRVASWYGIGNQSGDPLTGSRTISVDTLDISCRWGLAPTYGVESQRVTVCHTVGEQTVAKVINEQARTVSRIVNTRKPGKRKPGMPVPPPDSVCEVTSDFSGMTLAQIMDVAERAAVIDWQGKLRKSSNPADWKVGSVTIKVADMLRAERTIDPKADAAKQLSRLPEDVRRAFLMAELAKLRGEDEDDASDESDE